MRKQYKRHDYSIFCFTESSQSLKTTKNLSCKKLLNQFNVQWNVKRLQVQKTNEAIIISGKKRYRILLEKAKLQSGQL